MDIHAQVLTGIVEHARLSSPNECCGLLVGSGTTIDESVRAANLHDSPTSYLLDPAKHLETRRRVRLEGREVIGAYHSHVRSPAVPSPADVAEAWSAEFLYVIVSLERAEADIRAYRIADGSVDEVRLVSVPGESGGRE